MLFKSVNPTTNKLIKQFKFVADSQIKNAINTSHAQYRQNIVSGQEGLQERLEKMRNLASVLDKRSQEYADIMAEEMGKPLAQGVGEVAKCVGHINYFVENGKQFI